ncbi:MAG TPA: hypothetical protein VGS19_02205 [Streptosporangiaceae bacterium]|nr:hypothetical protein [Streptosporangiaceae bacterium]
MRERDSVAEEVTFPDHPTPDTRREPDAVREPSVTQTFRERLERLPPNHPSSPRYHDGPRKPPPPDLPPLEHPHPDEPSDAQSDKPITHPDGSWEWKGRRLTPDQCHCANETLDEFRTIEGRDETGAYTDRGLTPAMRRVEARLEHGHLLDRTEEFALKSPDRFKEKLAKLIEARPNADPRKLARSIHDGVRYTLILDFDHYTNAVDKGHDQLAEAGYERIQTRPSWDEDEYKGVNSRWREPTSGLLFEVQFHTEESWRAKQTTHTAYERIEDPRTPVDEVEHLRAYQRNFALSVRIPEGALQIPAYKKER